MSSERLWAPWRLEYVKGEREEAAPAADLQFLPGADEGCFLCRAAAVGVDRESLVVLCGEKVSAVLNRFPYNNGHLLVSPLAHKGTLDELDAEEHLACMETVTRLTGALERLMAPQGFNIGLNLGKAAGAGLPGHLHWHIVPRWAGDTNFMPATAGVRVIPQSLEAAWEMLTGELGSA